MKVCLGCGQSLPLSDYYKSSRTKDGYRSRCKACYCAQTAAWKRENLERKRETDAAYRDKNLDQRREYGRGWKKANREKDNFTAAKRHAAKLKRTPDWLTDNHKQQIKNFYWLAKDLEVVSGQKYHVDHIVPLQGENVSGLHVPWNLQILPEDVNFAKNNSFDDWSGQSERLLNRQQNR